MAAKKREEAEATTEPSPKKGKSGSLWRSFYKDLEQQGTSSSRTFAADDTTDIDVKNFLLLPLEDMEKCNPFEWWPKVGKAKFPNMYHLAMKYLSIPATSVPSERVFSSAGDILTQKRSRLGDDNARMLICLHANLP